MERFVQLIVAGGLTLVVGLWISEVTIPWTTGWLVGAALGLFGIGLLTAGIGRELTVVGD